MKVAMCCLKYSDELKLDEEKVSNTLGIIYKLYQDKIKDLTEQELALLASYLSLKDEKYYNNYIKYLDKEKINRAIVNGKNSKEQLDGIEKELECMKLSFYDYELNKDLIAQTPLTDRASSKLLVLDKNTGCVEHKHFKDIVSYFESGDCIVLNDTKVIPARLIGEKIDTKAVIEVLLLKELKDDCWEALTRPAKRVKVGTIVSFGNLLKMECVEVKDEGIRVFKLIYEGILMEILDKLGTMPLPPYIHEELKDKDRYQTVYAKNLGSAAAPTAGLHFTNEVLKELKEKGVNIAYVTLHVGLGTFRPVNTENILEHEMHSEYYEINKENIDIINKTKENNKKIVVVGTTTVRVLETVMNRFGTLKECSGFTNIFIYPGYKFKIVDSLITNFHLPKSTLVMLVSALAGRENILNAYKIAQDNNYRFFSFGDSMFIYDKKE